MGLTDTALRSLKPKDKMYKMKDERGLYIFIKPNGSKYFQYDYRYANKRKTLYLGTYPDISLREAREKMENAKKLLKDEQDPAMVKKVEKTQAGC